MSAIHQAVRRGDLREVGRLLDSGADIETYNEAGETPLMAACVSADAPPELVRLLLDRGADPNYRSAAGYTPVIHAACAGRMDVIEWLLSAGASPDGVTSYGESALSVLSRPGEFGHVARLLERGADPAPLKWTPLHRAAALGAPDEISALLDKGADPESVDFWERTPLLVAIHAGKIENASLLLERGANRAATGRCGRTAMHYPPDRDDAPMLRWLLDRGFPADGMDDFKGTPLMHAVECGAPACFEALIDEGVADACLP